MNRRKFNRWHGAWGLPWDWPRWPAQAEPPAADAEGFRPLFDGKTLDGWDGDPKFWRVEEGCITGQTTKENPAAHNTFLIWRGGKPADFQLKIEFRMPNPGFANSGVQIRSWEGPEKWQVSGYQPDMDWDDHYTGICYGENYPRHPGRPRREGVIGKDGKPKVRALRRRGRTGQVHQEPRLERVRHHRPRKPHHREDQRPPDVRSGR